MRESIYGRVMAYVNVAEWKTDQVCEWLKGAKENLLSVLTAGDTIKRGKAGERIVPRKTCRDSIEFRV